MKLQGRTIGILVAAGFDDAQVVKVAQVLKSRGARVLVIGIGETSAVAVAGRQGALLKPDLVLSEVSSDTIDALVIPGGDSVVRTRMDERVLTLLLQLDGQEKPIGVIRNAGSILAAAGLVSGRRVTGDEAIKRDLSEAGATFVQQGVVVDHNLVSLRSTDSVMHFIDAISLFLEPTPTLQL